MTVRRGTWTTRRARTRGTVALGAALLVGGLLTACSGHPGAAAVVDGEPLGTDVLTTAYEELSPVFPGVTTADLLTILVTEPLLSDVAAERGLGVSDEQARTFLEEAATQQLGEAAGDVRFGDAAVAVARYSLAAQGLQGAQDAQAAADEFRQRVLDADIEVNPRFGTFEDTAVAPPARPSWVVPEGGRTAEGGQDSPEGTPVPAPTAR
ncbi:hypothetical protein GC089_14165 [Cellulomonas sp. JZ18]|uniref:hypothetical protein n=1 Tax=Cellulomonas sp. JZ18 TaxID=2654191 RepID=UPI0012D499F5|nr:hypothetical protein [Cellulomonas sp. JZ18]QGQ20143.1 hypothetical protein GC089_14165 [Cellulomonas sp. JZ18]